MTRKLVLAGGGTGGHVYPALAIGDAMRARGHEVVYYGDPRRLEGRVVEKRGYALRPVRARPWPREGWGRRLLFAGSLALATCRAWLLLRRDRADAVLSVGSYVSAPTVFAAWIRGIPRIIHEANVTPGMANQLCARFADEILLTYEDSRDRIPGRAPRQLVGCPVDLSVLEGDRGESLARYGLDPDRPVLLVVGGSLGAARINEIAVHTARRQDRGYQVLHITGPRYYEAIRQSLDPLPPGVVLVSYEHRMADAYAVADLVMCRAGSSTLAELTLLGQPSILVPSPNVAENHQEANARGLENAGAAIMFTEEDLSVDRVLDCIARIIADKRTLAVMSEAASSLGRRDTAPRVADLLERWMNVFSDSADDGSTP